MKQSELFIGITVALGAVFLGTCVYYRENLGIPSDVFVGQSNIFASLQEEKKGPHCTPFAVWHNSTIRYDTFWCREFPAAIEHSDMKPVPIKFAFDQRELLLSTMNPRVLHTCIRYRDGEKTCRFQAPAYEARFYLWDRMGHDDALQRTPEWLVPGDRRPRTIQATDQDGTVSYKTEWTSFEFQSSFDPDICAMEGVCVMVGEEQSVTNDVVFQEWQLKEFEFMVHVITKTH